VTYLGWLYAWGLR